MIEHFGADEQLGAAVFTVILPNKLEECSAYPNVCIGCGTGFRRTALLEVGGLPEDFFMAAEDHDLSLRLLNGGWEVRRFEDLRVIAPENGTVPFFRPRCQAGCAKQYNSRPADFSAGVALGICDSMARALLSADGDCRSSAFGFLDQHAISGVFRGIAARRAPISARAFEQFAKVEESILKNAAGCSGTSGFRILLIDLGKNIPAYLNAARCGGIEIVAICDQRLGGLGLRYGGIPILKDEQARALSFDAAIVSNLSPVDAPRRAADWRDLDSRPVLNLFEGEDLIDSCIPLRAAA